MAAPKTTQRGWIFTTAKTDALLLTAAATERIVFSYISVKCAKSNTGDVAVHIGFTSGATLTIPTNDDLTGVEGVLFTHGGISPGGGAVEGPAAQGGSIGVGNIGEDVRVTCSAATGGSVRIVMQYRILADQDQV